MEMNGEPFRHLLTGIDTVECAYFLKAKDNVTMNFADIAVRKEQIRSSRFKGQASLTFGGIDFLLHPSGTKSGYPFLISNKDFSIQFGEFNNPSFFVKYSSQALWREGLEALHHKFLSWAETIGFVPVKPESLSRVDPSFDYFLKEVDFNEDSFITESVIDAKYRKNGKVQTFDMGKGEIKLRVYDKSAEITDKSGKAYFFDLWNGQSQNVWRIEWQLRKTILRTFGIRTVSDLDKCGPIILEYISRRDTLRIPTKDSNRSRWPLHPIWTDLQNRINAMERLPQTLYEGKDNSLSERKFWIAVSVFGYLKRVAAIEQLLTGSEIPTPEQSLEELTHEMKKLYDPLTWRHDVKKKAEEMKAGK
jgi:hypothetical protein